MAEQRGKMYKKYKKSIWMNATRTAQQKDIAYYEWMDSGKKSEVK